MKLIVSRPRTEPVTDRSQLRRSGWNSADTAADPEGLFEGEGWDVGRKYLFPPGRGLEKGLGFLLQKKIELFT